MKMDWTGICRRLPLVQSRGWTVVVERRLREAALAALFPRQGQQAMVCDVVGWASVEDFKSESGQDNTSL